MRVKQLMVFAWIIPILTAFFIVSVPVDQCEAKTFSIEIENWLGTEDFEGVAKNILKVLRNIVAGVAIIMLVISGIIYILSVGDENRASTAKRIMTGAIIGLVIILGAETILRELYIIFDKTGGSDIDNAKRLSDIVQRVLNVLLSVLGMIGIIALIFAATDYFTSAGDEGKAEIAKKKMTWAIVGIVIAVVSLFIVKQIAFILS